MFLDLKVKIVDDDGQSVFGPGLISLLEFIKSADSMKEACADMGISYSKGWKIINRAEKILGKNIILRQHGGSKGGKCNITEYGDSLIKRYKNMNADIEKEAERIFYEYFTEYKD